MRGSARVAGVLAGLCLGALAAEAAAQGRAPEGRWRAEERCEGSSTSRSFILSSDGAMLTARMPGPDVNSFGAIIGFAPLLPGGRFSIDISLGGSDAKSTYTGRVHDNRSISSDGGAWSGSNFRPCRLSATWLGPLPTAGGRAPAAAGRTTAGRPEQITGPTSAGRPEPIPRQQSGPTSAGRPEPAPAPAPQPVPAPVPAPARQPPAAAAALPPCEDAGPAPSALGADGIWRPTCTPRSGAAARPAPPPAATPPVRQPAPSAGTTAGTGEADQLRRQLEEERARREAAERALRLNEALGRQGRN